MNKFAIIATAALCVIAQSVAAAVPAAIDKAAKEMFEAGGEVRAGYTDSLGVFVIASGSANITGSKAKAKKIARINAVNRLAEFMGSQIESSSTSSSSSHVLVAGPISGKDLGPGPLKWIPHFFLVLLVQSHAPPSSDFTGISPDLRRYAR